jgi:beta-glucosidase
VAAWFADYARVVHDRLGDRVRYWTTLNEPWVSMDGGYMEGAHAPGHRCVEEAARAAHHLLRAHGTAAQALRAAGAGQVGLVVNIEPKYPATDAPDDHAAADRAEAYMNRYFLDPVFFGR